MLQRLATTVNIYYTLAHCADTEDVGLFVFMKICPVLQRYKPKSVRIFKVCKRTLINPLPQSETTVECESWTPQIKNSIMWTMKCKENEMSSRWHISTSFKKKFGHFVAPKMASITAPKTFLGSKSLPVQVWGIFGHSSLQKIPRRERFLGCLSRTVPRRSIHRSLVMFRSGDCEGGPSTNL